MRILSFITIAFQLPKLERVDLSDNRFESFTFSQHCLASIKRLKLNDNGLIDLPKLATVPIQELILYNNPLDCDWNICENSDTLNLLLNKVRLFG
jgi:Leucine-rich repeat (LRR) protein